MRVYFLNPEHFSTTLQERLNTLLHMLSSKAPTLTHEKLQALMNNGNVWIFVAQDDEGSIGGMLTLTRCHTLSDSKYWIEDVIVDEAYRGRGIGRALVKAAVAHANAIEAHPRIYLTSNPSRTSARALYRSEGFEEYETGVFRIV